MLRYNGFSFPRHFTLSMPGPSLFHRRLALCRLGFCVLARGREEIPRPVPVGNPWARGYSDPARLHAWLLVAGSWGAQEIGIGVGKRYPPSLARADDLCFEQPAPTGGRLTAVILPVAALAVLLPLILPERPVQLTTTPLLLAHLAMAFLAYALFTIAALHAGVMSLLEKRLHAHAVHSAVAKFPPLLTLEKLLFTIIGIGFVLLTLALVSGILFSEQVFGKPFSFAYFTQHKTVFALLSWLIYAGLLLGRQIYGWRGRTAIAWSLTGFAMLVLAYLGSKVALQLLGR